MRFFAAGATPTGCSTRYWMHLFNMIRMLKYVEISIYALSSTDTGSLLSSLLKRGELLCCSWEELWFIFMLWINYENEKEKRERY